MANPKDIQFFLGSNTKHGFISLFEQLRDPANDCRLYILKGGPGSGKSSLMRRIAKECEIHGHRIEYIPCASDPNSLDAITDYDAGISVMDGTAPHTFDPKYPGAYDSIIDLGEAWDWKELSKNKKRIIELNDVIASYHDRATSCIKAAAELFDANMTLAKKYVNSSAVEDRLQMFTGELQGCDQGHEHKRLLSAISVGKLVFFETTLTTMCTKLYILPDEWGAASGLLLSRLRDEAVLKKLDFIVCYNSIQTPDKIDHILFPSIKMGITTSNSFHAARCQTNIIVDNLMTPIKKPDAYAMADLNATAHYLIKAAGDYVARAKLYHDELEAFYITAMDFSRVDAVYDKLIHEILKEETP